MTVHEDEASVLDAKPDHNSAFFARSVAHRRLDFGHSDVEDSCLDFSFCNQQQEETMLLDLPHDSVACLACMSV